MRFMRATDVRILQQPVAAGSDKTLKDYLMPDSDNQDVEQFAGVIAGYLVNMPKNIFLMCAVDEEALQGFLIAFAPPGYSYVFVAQAWLNPQSKEPKTSDLVFLRLMQWADSIDRREIRMETHRDPLAYTRRWGFKQIRATMSLSITDDFETKLLDLLSHSGVVKELTNGTERSETDQHADVGAEQNLDGSVSLATCQSGGQGDAVQRDAVSNERATVQPDVGVRDEHQLRESGVPAVSTPGGDGQGDFQSA